MPDDGNVSSLFFYMLRFFSFRFHGLAFLILLFTLLAARESVSERERIVLGRIDPVSP